MASERVQERIGVPSQHICYGEFAETAFKCHKEIGLYCKFSIETIQSKY